MNAPGSLQKEIGQTVPFRSAAQEAGIAIARTADVLGRRYDDALAPYGITSQQYNVLRILRGARGKPLRMLDVRERMIQRTPGITRLVDKLEEKGLVARKRCDTDRRVIFCTITDAGLGLLAATDALIDTLDARVGQGLEEAELQNLIDLLGRIRSGGT